jgi:hypothetical protein
MLGKRLIRWRRRQKKMTGGTDGTGVTGGTDGTGVTGARRPFRQSRRHILTASRPWQRQSIGKMGIEMPDEESFFDRIYRMDRIASR